MTENPMARFDRADRSFWFGTIKSEALTYFVPVPILAIFAFSNFRFARERPLVFILAVAVAGLSTLALGLWLRYRWLAPLRRALVALRHGKTMPAVLEAGVVRAYRWPQFEAVFIFVRWALLAAPMVALPLYAAGGLAVSEVALIFVLMAMTGGVSIPLYYLIFEREAGFFLGLPGLRGFDPGRLPILRIGVAQKMIGAVALTIAYPTGNFLVLYIYYLRGYIDFAANAGGLTMLAVASVSLSIVVAVSLAGSVRRTVSDLSQGFASAAAGDVGQRVGITSADEIGQMVSSFNGFARTLSSDLGRVRDTAEKLGEWVADLRASADGLAEKSQGSAANSRLILGKMEEFAGSLEGLRRGVKDEDALADRSAAEVRGLSDGVAAIADAARSLADSAAASTRAVETGRRQIAESIDGANALRGAVDALAEKVSWIGDRTQRIDEAVAGIDDVAERTQILSMNASIEASHAGAAGKGFAVVAQEIRKLSESTTLALANVKDIVKQIREAVASAGESAASGARLSAAGKEAAERATEALTAIVGSSAEMAERIGRMGAAAQEQGRTSAGVAAKVRELREILAASGREVESQAQAQAGILAATRAVDEHARENADLAESLSALAADLKRESDLLTGIIAKFKLENVGR
jgi:methyl-accepting chemotaxis protein